LKLITIIFLIIYIYLQKRRWEESKFIRQLCRRLFFSSQATEKRKAVMEISSPEETFSCYGKGKKKKGKGDDV